MTNSEAKAILNKINPFIDDSEKTKYFESIELMIECFEENAKLKAEIERIEGDYIVLARQYNNVENSSIEYYNEVKQLRSELKQSVKLPCKVGNTIYLLDFEENRYDEATVEEFVITRDGKIEINSDYEIGTWSEDEYVKYSKESAEQALKGKVGE